FVRQEARWILGEDQQRRVAVLIDTSASLRRGDLWSRARAMAGQVIADCRPTEELAVFAFDATTRPVLAFTESATLDPSRRQGVATARLDRLEPTWAATNLGQALIDAVAAIEDVADRSANAGRMPRRIVLISDLQQGSRLDALGEFEWPSDVELDVKSVSSSSSNAGLHRLDDPLGDTGPPPVSQASGTGSPPVSQDLTGKMPVPRGGDRRVRVFNDPGSRREKFALRWAGGD